MAPKLPSYLPLELWAHISWKGTVLVLKWSLGFSSCIGSITPWPSVPMLAHLYAYHVRLPLLSPLQVSIEVLWSSSGTVKRREKAKQIHGLARLLWTNWLASARVVRIDLRSQVIRSQWLLCQKQRKVFPERHFGPTVQKSKTTLFR